MAQKILLIDDDLYIRELYEEVLKNAGYDVQTAVDGEEGVHFLMSGGYDLILLDMMMPKVDGLGVLNALAAKSPAQKNGPIILLSNLGNEPVIEEILQKGAVAYLIKADITPDQLLDCVAKNLGK